MKYGDHISSIFLAILGIVLIAEGVHLGLKFKFTIGPGFFPFVIGIMLSFFSSVLFLQTLLRKDRGTENMFWKTADGRNQILLALIGIICYTFFLNKLGFLSSTFLLLLFLFKIVAHLKWGVTIIGAIGSSISAYLIFEVWLRANLPSGIIQF